MAVATYTDDTLPAGERAALPLATDVVPALARPVEIGSRPSALTTFLASRERGRVAGPSRVRIARVSVADGETRVVNRRRDRESRLPNARPADHTEHWQA